MAEYIPITDQEIEPEAPITSILHHKLRDNLIAIAEGADGAPKVAYNAFLTEEGFVSGSSSVNVLRPAGFFEIGYEIGVNPAASLAFYVNVFNNIPTNQIHQRLPYVYIDNSYCTYYNNYHAVSPFDSTFLYILKRKDNSENNCFFYSCYHCSYGSSNYVEHPFIDFDSNLYDVYLVKLTKQQHLDIKKSTFQKIGGGFFDLTNYQVQNVDFFKEKRTFLESLFSFYDIEYRNTNFDYIGKHYIGTSGDMVSNDNVLYLDLPETIYLKEAKVILK